MGQYRNKFRFHGYENYDIAGCEVKGDNVWRIYFVDKIPPFPEFIGSGQIPDNMATKVYMSTNEHFYEMHVYINSIKIEYAPNKTITFEKKRGFKVPIETIELANKKIYNRNGKEYIKEK